MEVCQKFNNCLYGHYYREIESEGSSPSETKTKTKAMTMTMTMTEEEQAWCGVWMGRRLAHRDTCPEY